MTHSKKIEVKHVPSEWKCVWLYPTRPNTLFNAIQTWEWVRDYTNYNEDEYLESV